jgi:hypothetical protein
LAKWRGSRRHHRARAFLGQYCHKLPFAIEVVVERMLTVCFSFVQKTTTTTKKTFAMLESGTHYRRFMEKDDPKNGGEFRQRFGVGSTRPMFKSTDERKRPFYLYVNHISPLTLVETLLITLL